MSKQDSAQASAPAVSVIVPVYNQADFLNTCIQSIRAQVLSDFELILIDDGSTDASARLCDDCAAQDKRTRVIHQANAGLSAARNAGIDASTGNWLCFVDADDWIHPLFLQMLLSAAQVNKAQVASCFIEHFESGTPAPQLSSEPQIELRSGRAVCSLLEAYRPYWFVTAWAKLYARSVFEGIRFPLGKRNEDEAIAHRLYLPLERVVTITEPLYGYRENPAGIMSQDFSASHFDALDAFEDRISYYISAGEPELARRVVPVLKAHQAELNLAAIFYKKEEVIPQKWLLSEAEILTNIRFSAMEDPLGYAKRILSGESKYSS